MAEQNTSAVCVKTPAELHAETLNEAKSLLEKQMIASAEALLGKGPITVDKKGYILRFHIYDVMPNNSSLELSSDYVAVILHVYFTQRGYHCEYCDCSAALPCAGKSIYKLTLLVYAVGLALFCQPDPDGPRAVRVITQIPMRVRLSYVLVVYTRVYWPYTVLFLYFWAVLWLKKRCPWTEGY